MLYELAAGVGKLERSFPDQGGTARRYRTIGIRAGQHTLTAENPLPADLHDALAQII